MLLSLRTLVLFHLLGSGLSSLQAELSSFAHTHSKLFQIPLATIFPNPSLSTYAHGVFGSWVNTINHLPGTDCA